MMAAASDSAAVAVAPEPSRLPVRPYVPPTAFLALGACMAAALMLEAGWRLRDDVHIVCVPLVLLLAGAAVLLFVAGGLWRKVRRMMRLLAVGLLVGTLASIWWLCSWQGRSRALVGTSASAYCVRVRGDPSFNDFGASMSVDLLDKDTGSFAATARMTATGPYEAGTELEVVGALEALDESDWARSRFMRGEVASLKAIRVHVVCTEAGLSPIAVLRKRILTAIDPARNEARALLAGIVCGRTTELNQMDANSAFARCGLSHLVAVSGSHLALIAVLLQGCLRSLGMRASVQQGVLLAVMGAYVVFTGCAASAVRSVLMVGFGMAAKQGMRRVHPLSGLSLTVFVLVALNPGVVYDLGFQLSAVSVLFILVFGRYMGYLLQVLRIPQAISEPLALTLVAQWATLPLTVPVFGELSLVAPLANLVVGPAMSALLVAGLVCAPIVVFVPALSWVLMVPDALARGSVFLSEAMASFPYATLAVEGDYGLAFVAYGFALILYALWRDWRRWHLAVALGGCFMLASAYVGYWVLFTPAAITVLDVGQADAILVRDGSHTLLVDAGVDDEVVAALARNHVFGLDAVAVTHWDADHWGGLPDVLESIPVRRLLVAEGAAAQMPVELVDAGVDLIEVNAGDTVRVGAFECEVVWPLEPVEGEENADSLCLDISYAQGDVELDALLTGDTECEELGAYAPEVGDIDVLKVGHHGSKASLSEEALAVLKPEVAVASAGEGNAYGHPSDECISLVQETGAAFFCTKDVGDVVISPGSTGPRVVCAKQTTTG